MARRCCVQSWACRHSIWQTISLGCCVIVHTSQWFTKRCSIISLTWPSNKIEDNYANDRHLYLQINLMITSTQLLDQLHWRYATKHFDPTKKISESDLSPLLESLRLSPSSFGLQWRGFVVVDNKELREQVLPYSRNQKQVVEASHLIVLCRRTDVDTDFIQHYIDTMSTTRGIDAEHLDGFKTMLLWFLEAKDEQTLATWLTKQVYISLWFLLSSCALLGIDACPMEWFDTHKFDEILELKKHNLASCVIVPIGYRSPEDKYATMEKVRFPEKEAIIHL